MLIAVRSFASAPLAWAIVVALICFAPKPSQSQGTVVGMISDVTGDAQLNRGAVSKSARVGASLESGDTVVVRTGIVVIDLPGGAVTLKTGVAYDVPGGTAGSVGRLLDRISAALSSAQAGTVEARTRGVEEVPLLGDRNAPDRLHKIVVGRRALVVGRQPTQETKMIVVEVSQAGALLASARTADTRLTLPEATLATGRARMAVTDAVSMQDRADYDVEIVARLPDRPELAALGKADGRNFDRFLAAAALADMEAGIWKFEAYQALMALAPYPPAILLADMMARGEKLP